MIGAKEVERDIRLVADHPAVVSWRDVENVAGAHLEYAAVVHRRRGAAGHDHADMLDLAGALAERAADVDRPFPARLIGGAADRHAADAHQLEPAELELAHLVGIVEAFQNDVEVVHAAASTESPPASLEPSRSGERADPSSQTRQCGGSSSATCRL